MRTVKFSILRCSYPGGKTSSGKQNLFAYHPLKYCTHTHAQ